MWLYPLLALLTLFLRYLIINEEGSINEESTGAIKEWAMGAIMAPRNPVCVFISCFNVSITPSLIDIIF